MYGCGQVADRHGRAIASAAGDTGTDVLLRALVQSRQGLVQARTEGVEVGLGGVLPLGSLVSDRRVMQRYGHRLERDPQVVQVGLQLLPPPGDRVGQRGRLGERARLETEVVDPGTGVADVGPPSGELVAELRDLLVIHLYVSHRGLLLSDWTAITGIRAAKGVLRDLLVGLPLVP